MEFGSRICWLVCSYSGGVILIGLGASIRLDHGGGLLAFFVLGWDAGGRLRYRAFGSSPQRKRLGLGWIVCFCRLSGWLGFGGR